jgi:cytidine deaminase
MPLKNREEIRDRLVTSAKEACAASYSPYSHYRVGAALLCTDGRIFQGTNIENRSYGLTICAERSALSAAVTSGATEFDAVAVYSPDSEYPISPCGACRQVLSEFGGAEMEILMACDTRVEKHTLKEILPFDSLHELRESS